MQALSEMTDDDKLSIQAYLESRGAWTTEIGNQDSREYGEFIWMCVITQIQMS